MAWVIAACAWLMVITAIGALIASGTPPESVANWVMDLVTAVVYGGVVLMMLPRTRHPVVWILAVTALGCGSAGLATAYVTLSPTWPAQDLAFYVRYWAWVPGVYATVAIVPLLVVPHRRSHRRMHGRSHRHPWPAVTLASGLILLATLPGLTVVRPGLPHNPFGMSSPTWQSLIERLGLWPDRAVAVFGAVLWITLLIRVLRTPRRDRHGLGWLLAGHGSMVLALSVFLLPWPKGWGRATEELSGSLLLLAQLFLPAALLVLVLGRQMWGMDVRISRATVRAMMTVALALAYMLLIAVTAHLLPQQNAVALALAVGVVGLGATPLHRLVRRHVDRLVHGDAADITRMLASPERVDGHDVDTLATALRQGLRLADAQIVVAGQDDPVGAADAVPDGDVVLTLTSRGRTVGVLVARPRPGERLDARTIRVLTEVAGLLGQALDLSQSVAALTQARRRTAEARHEERRLLRRALHDGLGPALAGIRLGLVAARELRDRDPGAADEMLEALTQELSRQGEEVRQLSRSLIPLALEDGDLASALRAMADRFTGQDLTVAVSVAPEVELDSPVQVAIYQMVGEALLNASRHARASQCDVVLRRRADGDTLLTVSDNGIGYADNVAEGVGLRSLRERAEELGATLTMRSTGAGSRFELRLPSA